MSARRPSPVGRQRARPASVQQLTGLARLAAEDQPARGELILADVAALTKEQQSSVNRYRAWGERFGVVDRLLSPEAMAVYLVADRADLSASSLRKEVHALDVWAASTSGGHPGRSLIVSRVRAHRVRTKPRAIAPTRPLRTADVADPGVRRAATVWDLGDIRTELAVLLGWLFRLAAPQLGGLGVADVQVERGIQVRLGGRWVDPLPLPSPEESGEVARRIGAALDELQRSVDWLTSDALLFRQRRPRAESALSKTAAGNAAYDLVGRRQHRAGILPRAPHFGAGMSLSEVLAWCDQAVKRSPMRDARDQALLRAGMGWRAVDLSRLRTGPEYFAVTDDAVHVLLTHSKSDPNGDGTVTGWQHADHPDCAHCALLVWEAALREWRQGRDGLLFPSLRWEREGGRMNTVEVGLALERLARAHGLPAGHWTSRSLRVGGVTEMAVNGASLQDIARLTLHTWVQSVGYYLRLEDVTSGRLNDSTGAPAQTGPSGA